MSMLIRGQQLHRRALLVGVAAALAATEISAQASRHEASRREVQRLPIRREQRRKRGVALLGDLPRSEEAPAPDDAEPAVLDTFPGVADIALVQSMADTNLSEVKLVQGENVSSMMDKVAEVILNDVQDVFYLLTIKLGTPLRTAELIIDTGSSDFWIQPQGIDHDVANSSYSTEASTSFQAKPSAKYRLDYGQGKVWGYKGMDHCCLEGLCVDEEPFVLAYKVNGIGNDGLYDGLLGLAFPYLAQCKECSLIQQVLKAHTYTFFAFGLLLAHDNQQSYMEFGELELLKSTAQETFGDGVILPLFGLGGKAAYWMTKPEAIHAGNVSVSTYRVYAVLDSGTSFFTVPEDHYKLIWPLLVNKETKKSCSDKLKNAEGTMLCVCGTQLNALSFVFRDHGGMKSLKVTLGPDDLLSPDIWGKLTDGTHLCEARFVKGPKHMQFWLFGDLFLRHVYAIHDVHNVKMHLYFNGKDASAGGMSYGPSTSMEAHDVPATTVSEAPFGEDAFSRGFILWLILMVTCFSGVACLKHCKCISGAQAREDVYSQLLN